DRVVRFGRSGLAETAEHNQPSRLVDHQLAERNFSVPKATGVEISVGFGNPLARDRSRARIDHERFTIIRRLTRLDPNVAIAHPRALREFEPGAFLVAQMHVPFNDSFARVRGIIRTLYRQLA